jgi:hypothetical protein
MDVKFSILKWEKSIDIEDPSNKCVICLEKAAKDQFCEIYYHPTVPIPDRLKNFKIRAPLCSNHKFGYEKGRRFSKLSMRLMISAILPFLISLIFIGFELPNARGIAAILLFVSLILLTGAFGFFSGANDLLKKNGRGAFIIKFIKGDELTATVPDPKLIDYIKKYFS